jgi:hypothetical protein
MAQPIGDFSMEKFKERRSLLASVTGLLALFVPFIAQAAQAANQVDETCPCITIWW